MEWTCILLINGVMNYGLQNSDKYIEISNESSNSFFLMFGFYPTEILQSKIFDEAIHGLINSLSIWLIV